MSMTYDQQERRIWCRDCETNVDPFDAFVTLIELWAKNEGKLDQRQQRLDEAEAEKLVSLAAREIDKVWRKRRVLPACPTCKSGLFPEDFKSGVRSTIGREFAEASRRAQEDK